MIKYVPLSLSENKLNYEIPLGLPPEWRSLKAHLSLKAAGDLRSANFENRLRYFTRMGLNPQKIFALKQIHSQTVRKAPFKGPARGDGLISREREIILTVTVGDCLPLFIIDKRTKARGLLHSGWKGTGIINLAVRMMDREYGTVPSDLSVIIGPGIGACCYHVQEERFRFFKETFGDNTAITQGDKYFIDLKQANINLLVKIGVKDIVVIKDCTFCNKRLSSSRRDGPHNLSIMLATFGHYVTSEL